MHKQLRGIFLFLVYTFSVLLPHGALLAKSQSDEKTVSRNFFELQANWHQEKPLEPYELHRKNPSASTAIASGHIEGRFNAMDNWEGVSVTPITLKGSSGRCIF